MTIYIYVEGKSDVSGLGELLSAYQRRWRHAAIGTRIIPLGGKDAFLRKIGARALGDIREEPDDRVVAMPDLHPMRRFQNTPYAHDSYDSLVVLLQRVVRERARTEGWPESAAGELLDRFHAFPLSHDLEVLLLAAHDKLRAYLRTTASLRNAFRHPAEAQDDTTPPKRVVEELFVRYLKRGYRPTIDAPAALRTVSPSELRDSGECPRFAEFLDTLGHITGVPLP